MQFHLTIDCDNAAFDGGDPDQCGEEIARILRHVARRMADGSSGLVLRDSNGNKVGTASLVSETPASRVLDAAKTWIDGAAQFDLAARGYGDLHRLADAIRAWRATVA